MRCNVCGLEYGMAHNCPGAITGSALDILNAGMEAPTNGGIGYYLGEAFKIVRWDDVAIRRNAKDQRATMYAVVIWLASIFLILCLSTWPYWFKLPAGANPSKMILALVTGVIFMFVVLAIVTLVQLSLCHSIAKLFFGAKGRFIEVMRPLLLGWIVNLLGVIPVAGTLLAAIGWTAVLMMVFEEVDEIERLQAFGISAGINVVFSVLMIMLIPARHPM
ncbi:MAG TPA: hypothetical protein VMH89_14890 [Candidatus Acidoferrum sp.]|nr:hypothetical protein [Candidatus Acidoferrum sp.]